MFMVWLVDICMLVYYTNCAQSNCKSKGGSSSAEMEELRQIHESFHTTSINELQYIYLSLGEQKKEKKRTSSFSVIISIFAQIFYNK